MCRCIETIQEVKLVKARKDYIDDARDFILDSLPELRSGSFAPKLSFKEWRLIATAIRDGWMIRKGEIHQHSVHKMDGQIYSWRSKPGLSELCGKYELFPEC
jgi:hypothetical protein